MEFSTRTRRTVSTLLAVFLAVESVSAVAVAAAATTVTQPTTVSYPLPADVPAGAPLATKATAAPAAPAGPAPRFSAPAWAPAIVEPVAPPARATVKTPDKAAPGKSKAPKAKSAIKVTTTKQATKRVKTSKARTTKAAPAKGSTTSGGRAASYSGTNHVWIPALGISKSIHWFPCDRQRPPDNYMYRWGCAGSNNVYLMGHAYSVMNGLHDAYVAGRLHAGMKAYYAGSDGDVHVYAVKWWKLTRPTTDAAWAWAPQAVPSMTLQTCVGKNSEYRLMVRLVEIGG